jgi:hypothetical protein
MTWSHPVKTSGLIILGTGAMERGKDSPKLEYTVLREIELCMHSNQVALHTRTHWYARRRQPVGEVRLVLWSEMTLVAGIRSRTQGWITSPTE